MDAWRHAETAYLPFHGGNRGSNPLGDANPNIGWKINGLCQNDSLPLYRQNVYHLYMNQAPVRTNGAALGGLSANQVLSIGITAPVTLSDG
jgi:hypothetical protein